MKRSLAALALLIFCAPMSAHAAGALALSNPAGSYGWAVRYPSQAAADASVLEQCGGNCTVVQRFTSTCAAYAADQTPGSIIIGWAAGFNARQPAEERAMQECRNRGGAQCVLRNSGCDD